MELARLCRQIECFIRELGKQEDYIVFIARMIRAAKLEPHLYEVKTDTYATSQALVVVLLSSLAASIGAFTHASLGGLIMGGLVALLIWYVWAFMTYNRSQTLPCIPEFGKSPGVMAYAWLCQRSWDAPRLWSHTRTHRDCVSRYRRVDAHCLGYCSTAGQSTIRARYVLLACVFLVGWCTYFSLFFLLLLLG